MVFRRARAPPQAKAKAIAKAAARKIMVDRSNERLYQRLIAIRSLNDLALEAGTAPVPLKVCSWKPVDRLVKLLQRRLTSEASVAKLREAAKRWEQNGGRLKLCAAHANANHDLDGLCRGLLKRVEELHRRKGDRLSK